MDRKTLKAALREIFFAEPLPGFPIEKDDAAAFRYGKDCAYAAVDKLLDKAD